MPGSWPKAKLTGVSGLVASIRSKRAGSLPVQTGFPTSLADLVVKNRDRLKKPSKKRKPLPPAPAAPIWDPVPTAADAGATTTPSVSPEIDCSGAPVPVSVSNCPRTCNETYRIGFFTVKAVLLVALVIGGKRLVAGVTFWASVLVVLEAVGARVFGFLKPCPVAKRRLRQDSVIGGLVLERRERVSPIREFGALDSVQSDRSWVDLVGLEIGEGLVEKMTSCLGERTVEVEVDSGSLFALIGNLAEERRDLVGYGNVELEGDRKSSMNYKAKKLLRKFIPKKYRGSRDGKDGKVLHVSSRGISVQDPEGEEVGEVLKGEEDEEDGNEQIPSTQIGYDSLQLRAGDRVCIGEVVSEKFRLDKETAAMAVISVGNNRSWSLLHLGFCIIVLFGLVGGKVAALGLTMVWFVLAKLTESAWMKWKMSGHSGF